MKHLMSKKMVKEDVQGYWCPDCTNSCTTHCYGFCSDGCGYNCKDDCGYNCKGMNTDNP